MKQFVQFTLSSGHVFEVSTKPIAEDRAKYYFERERSEFPTIEDAMKDTVEYFDDSREITEWLFNNMNIEPLLAQHGRLVAFNAPQLDFSAVETDFSDEPSETAKLDGKTLMDMPVGMVAASMLASGEVCGAQMIMDPRTGQPVHALVFVTGGPWVVDYFMRGIKIVTENCIAQMDKQLEAERQEAQADSAGETKH